LARLGRRVGEVGNLSQQPQQQQLQIRQKTGLKNPTKANGPRETDSHWEIGGFKRGVRETHDRRPKDWMSATVPQCRRATASTSTQHASIYFIL